MCFAIGGTLLTKIAMGLTVAKGVADTVSNIKSANARAERDAMSQIGQIRQYNAEKEARDLDMRHQLEQLRNQQVEAEEQADDEKGDIALAAQKARSKLAASQASSGLQVGQGTFGNILQAVGFEQSRDIEDVDANLRNKKTQIHTEREGAKIANRVPEPYLPEIGKPATGLLMLGGGLQVASGLVGLQNQFGSLNKNRNAPFTG